MIPLTDKQTITVENNGVSFTLRYLTEIDKQVQYLKITQFDDADREKFSAEAEKTVDAALTGKAREKAVTMAVYELLIASREKNPALNIAFMRGFVDIFVSGWTGGKLAAYPENGKPSDVLRIGELYCVYRTVQENIAELTGLTVDEVKN